MRVWARGMLFRREGRGGVGCDVVRSLFNVFVTVAITYLQDVCEACKQSDYV